MKNRQTDLFICWVVSFDSPEPAMAFCSNTPVLNPQISEGM